MRLIDADALVEWLKRAGNFLKIETDHKRITHIIGKIIDHIEAMLTIDPESLRPKWISVEDRLPEQHTSVIVWDGQSVGEAMWEGDIFEWVSDENIAFVTHWMPLPEPPNCGADMRGGT